jgi:hypothetical protein
MLWGQAGNGAGQIYNAWTTAVKLSWNVPRATRTYLVQKVLFGGITSAKVDILARYANFYRGLRKSPSPEVAVISKIAGRDIRSTIGRNMKLLEEASGMDPWIFDSSRLKMELVSRETVEVSEQDTWRVKYLHKLMVEKQEKHYMGEVERVKQVRTSLTASASTDAMSCLCQFHVEGTYYLNTFSNCTDRNQYYNI